MGITLQWLGHASFKLTYHDNIIYIDPWKIDKAAHDATIILISHSHYDHYNPKDIIKISNPQTEFIGPADVIAQHKKGRKLIPGQEIKLNNIIIKAVAAYTPQKQYHPKNSNWLGFIIQVEGKQIYYAGDTDLTTEMKGLANIDIALLPVGGTYTMDSSDAAEATNYLKPTIAIPYHWGDIVGSIQNAEQFAKLADCDINILNPGQEFIIEQQPII